VATIGRDECQLSKSRHKETSVISGLPLLCAISLNWSYWQKETLWVSATSQNDTTGRQRRDRLGVRMRAGASYGSGLDVCTLEAHRCGADVGGEVESVGLRLADIYDTMYISCR
jgi:hypothetical protein